MPAWTLKTPEEREAQRTKRLEKIFRSQALYVAEKTDIDYKDIVRVYKDAPEGLTARYNSLSGAREMKGFCIAGLAICGAFAAAGIIGTAVTGNPQNIPFISTILTILSAIGLSASNKKIDRIGNSLQAKVETGGRNAAAPAPGGGGTGPY